MYALLPECPWRLSRDLSLWHKTHTRTQVHLLIMGVFSRLQEYPWIGKGVSRLVWFEVCFGVAASVVGAAFVIKKLTKAKKPHTVPSLCPSSPPHSPLLPPYSRSEAYYLCPSLVIMSLNQKGDLTHSPRSVRDFGFIVNMQDEIATVWGSSWFLYDLDMYIAEGFKKLALGKVVVALEYPKLYRRTFEGIVVHVDYEFNLAVIKFKDPKCHYKPTATLAELDLDIDFSKPYFGLDFFTCVGCYFVEVHYFKDDACESCGPYLHIDLRKRQSSHGVILDSEKKIVGIKREPCNMCNNRGHVIPVSILSRLLSLYTQSHFVNDIRLCTDENTEIDKSSSVQESLDGFDANVDADLGQIGDVDEGIKVDNLIS